MLAVTQYGRHVPQGFSSLLYTALKLLSGTFLKLFQCCSERILLDARAEGSSHFLSASFVEQNAHFLKHKFEYLRSVIDMGTIKQYTGSSSQSHASHRFSV